MYSRDTFLCGANEPNTVDRQPFSRSVGSNSSTLWTVARQAPLSMGFSGQEYWSGLSCPPPGDLPHEGNGRRNGETLPQLPSQSSKNSFPALTSPHLSQPSPAPIENTVGETFGRQIQFHQPSRHTSWITVVRSAISKEASSRFIAGSYSKSPSDTNPPRGRGRPDTRVGAPADCAAASLPSSLPGWGVHAGHTADRWARCGGRHAWCPRDRGPSAVAAARVPG